MDWVLYIIEENLNPTIIKIKSIMRTIFQQLEHKKLTDKLFKSELKRRGCKTNYRYIFKKTNNSVSDISNQSTI